MGTEPSTIDERPCWFVGAVDDNKNDQTARFIESGIWQANSDKYKEMIRSIRPGDWIAIKSAYTQRNGLPFNNRNQAVSVMDIKATGIVIDNLGDGRMLKVDWKPEPTPRPWYFYTYRKTVWKVVPKHWMASALIDFTFHHKAQDIDQFRNHDFWRYRYGDITPGQDRFAWVPFYESIATKLLAYKNNRAPLLDVLNKFAESQETISILQDKHADGSIGPLRDICPFTIMGTFNRGLTWDNRNLIAQTLADFLGITESVPNTFEGIPILNNQCSWFFAYDYQRKADDIDALWDVFEKGITFAEADDGDERVSFMKAYDNAMERHMVKWNLTMGLYWIRPWFFITLDSRSRLYITKYLGLSIETHGSKGQCTARDYLKLRDSLEANFQEKTYPVHSFPELSLEAWRYESPSPEEEESQLKAEEDNAVGYDGIVSLPEDELQSSVPAAPAYTIHDILDDGCFFEADRLKQMLGRLETKKNIILQGPPGTGKSWLAKRLAFAHMGVREERRAKAVQFHANYCYEDFVRGFRPTSQGQLSLTDGIFLQTIDAAKKNPQEVYVFIIEEINRGNPAQIFGEMLTLLEADKRSPTYALELTYRNSDNERVHIPTNLYIIGTMNIADRSLALMDLALRRRFAFIDLEPALGERWRNWVHAEFKIPLDTLLRIEAQIRKLNDTIAQDPNLGTQFQIGHSFVTPPLGAEITDPETWFTQVARTEIGPTLYDYWYDDPARAESCVEALLKGFFEG